VRESFRCICLGHPPFLLSMRGYFTLSDAMIFIYFAPKSVKSLIIFCIILILCSCCFIQPMLYLSGDSEAVGAEIYIDGKKAGIMKKIIYPGWHKSRNPIIRERELRFQKESGIKPGDVFSNAQMKITYGKHTIEVISKNGKILKKEFITRPGENIIHVNFKDMTI
ncbi:MAG: hypothetical protein AB1756_08050, partial [Acidobacteriota bacterium]